MERLLHAGLPYNEAIWTVMIMFPIHSPESIFPETAVYLGQDSWWIIAPEREMGIFERENTCGHLNMYENKQENKNQIPGTRKQNVTFTWHCNGSKFQ